MLVYLAHSNACTIMNVRCIKRSTQISPSPSTPENLSSAFKKAGIYPFNSAVITPEQVAPSLIYRAETVEQEQATESDADPDSTIN